MSPETCAKWLRSTAIFPVRCRTRSTVSCLKNGRASLPAAVHLAAPPAVPAGRAVHRAVRPPLRAAVLPAILRLGHRGRATTRRRAVPPRPATRRRHRAITRRRRAVPPRPATPAVRRLPAVVPVRLPQAVHPRRAAPAPRAVLQRRRVLPAHLQVRRAVPRPAVPAARSRR